MPRTVNDATRALTRGFESFVGFTYDDGFYPPVPARASIPLRGTLTIGYGQTGAVAYFGNTCTVDRAEAWLDASLASAAAIVERDSDGIALTNDQFGALADFVFNCGIANFENSTLLKDLLANDLAGIPDQLRRWDHAGGQIVTGLDRRRDAEVELWNTPDSPSPVPTGEGATAPAVAGEGGPLANLPQTEVPALDAVDPLQPAT